MKALTIRHPWPAMFLLDVRPKRIENRTWAPPRALIGQYLALHGGRAPKTPADFKEVRAALAWIKDTVHGGDADSPEWLGEQELLTLCRVGIVAVARLKDVITASDDPWFVGPYGWVLDDVTPLDPPVPHMGMQGLWDVQPEALALVRERFRAAKTLAAPPTALTPTCGTCDHWTPTTPGMGTCQLGWAAHDNLRDSKGRPTQLGHGGLLLPEMQAGCSCLATVAGQAGYVARRGAR